MMDIKEVHNIAKYSTQIETLINTIESIEKFRRYSPITGMKITINGQYDNRTITVEESGLLDKIIDTIIDYDKVLIDRDIKYLESISIVKEGGEK